MYIYTKLSFRFQNKATCTDVGQQTLCVVMFFDSSVVLLNTLMVIKSAFDVFMTVTVIVQG